MNQRIETRQPLAGVKVLDLSSGVAGPVATKFLAGYGASVLKIEPPDGDPTRRWGAFADAPDPERSGWFLYLNTGKSSAVLDTAVAGDVERLNALIDAADVVVEDSVPGSLLSAGVDLADARRRRPALVIVSITPYGQDGPYAQRRASALTMFAAG